MSTVGMPTFGDLLRRYRAASGLTQEELAERAGLSAKGISDLERGARQYPRRETVRLLSEVLGLAERERGILEAAARRRLSTAGPSVAAAGASAVGGAQSGSTSRSASGSASREPTRLIGRNVQLELLDRHLAGSGPPLLLLAGEPGIGKSRLLREATAHATEQGWAVLDGGCHRRSGQEPYAPFLDLLERHLARQPAAERRLHLRGCAWLMRLLPELAETLSPPENARGLPPEQERRLMFAAVARYLANIAGVAGTLLMLDDLQWAGPDALDLLAFLVRTASGEGQLRVVAAYRDTDVQTRDPLSVLAADLSREGLASRMALAPLAEKDAAELLDLLLTDVTAGRTELERADLRRRLLKRTDGVPFFLVSCAQGLQAGVLGGDEQGAAGLPWSVAETIRQRVAALPEPARNLLDTAAVIGRTTTYRLLLATTTRMGWHGDELLGALEQACTARLIGEVGELGYAFAHDIVREVIGADLSAARRALLHQYVAETLEADPGEPRVETLAYHYSQSGVLDKAALYLERAGDQARDRFAHAEAQGQYALAAARLDELGRSSDGARIRESSAAELTLLHQYDEALAALAGAEHAYAGTGDSEGLRRVIAQVGWIYALRGQPNEGLPRVLLYLGQDTAQTPSQGLATVYLTLAALYLGAQRYREQLDAAERAVELAEAVGDDHIWLSAKARAAQALHLLGQWEESLHVLTVEVIPRAESSRDLIALWRALESVCTVHAARGDIRKLLGSLQRAREVAVILGDQSAAIQLTIWQGDYEFFAGDWKRAREEYARTAMMLRPDNPSRYSAFPPQRLGSLLLAQGNWEAALSALAEAERLARQTAGWEVLRLTQYSMAERDLLAGQAHTAYTRLAPNFETVDNDDRWSVEGVPMLAWAQLELGEVAQAEALLERAIAIMREREMRLVLIEALRVQALLVIRERRWPEAESALDEAVEVSRALASPYDEAKALYVYGLLHVGKGEMESARGRLDAALAILNRLGERLYAEHVERTLADVTRS
jgi:tetratricopeptide (TPR) repeat protein